MKISVILKTQGIIIKSSNFNEKDKVYTAFSNDLGIISCIAKGVRSIKSRRSPSLDTLNLVSLKLYKKGEIYYISEVALIENFEKIKKNFTTSAYAYFILENLLNLLQTDESSEDIFNDLLTVLESLNSTPKKRDVYLFLRKVVKASGFWNNAYDTQDFIKKLINNENLNALEQQNLSTFFIDLVEEIGDRKLKSKNLLEFN